VLVVCASLEPTSQQQAAQRLATDRTTMVALLDALESKAWCHVIRTRTTGAATWSN